MTFFINFTFHVLLVLLQSSTETNDLFLDASDAFTYVVLSALRVLQASFQTISFIRDVLCAFLGSFQLDTEV